MTEPKTGLTLYGPAYSAYTRIVRLVLVQKGVDYLFEEVDFVSEGMPAAQFDRHPFGKVPVLEHGGVCLRETWPICLYLDEVFPAPSLLPPDPAKKAAVLGLISCLDNYVWADIAELGTQKIFAPLVKGWPDDKIVERSVKRLTEALGRFDTLIAADGYLGGDQLTLADLHGMVMIAYLTDCGVEGVSVLETAPRLHRWWQKMKDHPGLAETAFDLGAYPWAAR